MNYNGIIPMNCNPANPNKSPACGGGNKDNPIINLSGTIQALVYINIDWRYGFNGKQDTSSDCVLESKTQSNMPNYMNFSDIWFNDARVFGDTNIYANGQYLPLNKPFAAEMCKGFSANSFNVQCK